MLASNRSLVVAAMLALGSAYPAAAVVRYVDASLAAGANDGTSWENAFQGPGGLQAALTAASSGDEIWVADGTYLPTLTTTRTLSFNLKNGVAIYGGFAGDEATLEERDFVANVTILSGDLAGNDPTITDNSHHIVRGSSANSTAILDGFTVTGGNANGAQAQNNDRGGGFLMITSSNGTIRNCRVANNRCTFGGGAGYINNSSPSFTNVSFEDNLGGAFGGAFDMASNCNPAFRRCSFIGNSAQRAGAVEVFGNSDPTISECVFFDNTSTGTGGGGAMWIGSASAPIIRDSTFVGNHANVTVGGILSTGSTTSISNCIVWANNGPGGSMTAAQQITNSGGTTTVTYSDVMGGFTGTGNKNVDPLFIDMAGGDLHLGAGSPVIDAGNNATVLGGVTTDRDGLPRFVDDPNVTDTGNGTPPLIDMGAYERQVEARVCVGDLDGNGSVDGADLGMLLAAWDSADPLADLDGSGLVDGADLGLLLGAWGDCPD
jgi:hypothetical protein